MDEAPFWIAVNGLRRVVLSCAPGGAEPLAAGYLIGEGWVSSAGEIAALVAETGPGGSSGVHARIPPELAARATARLEHQTRHGCGLRHYLDCDDSLTPAAGRGPATDALPVAFRELFATADAVSPTGGVHAAALHDGAGLLHASVDVARHCAVDRTIGSGALAGADAAELGLVLTSRISAAMVVKAVRAGLPWIASRSVATPLARELAASAGLALHEHAARRDRTDGVNGVNATVHGAEGG